MTCRRTTAVTIKSRALLGAAIVLLTACGERDVILPGERFDIRDTAQAFENTSKPVNFASARTNADWTHRNGAADHAMHHPALGSTLSRFLTAEIGEGDSRRARITADPVVSGDVIYTLDARARVTATSISGAQVWAADVTPGSDGASDASGGGLAIEGGRVYVTTGFGELTVLDATSGAEIWTQDLDAPGTSAPTVADGLVYVVAKNGTAYALDVNDGRIQWQTAGLAATASFGGGAGVAVNGDVAVIPFSSGQVIGAFPKGGLQRWSTNVAGARPGQAMAAFGDISADPVLSNGRAYVGNLGGQLVAIDLSDGEQIWSANDGAISPVWPAGNALFFVNDLNQLVRVDAGTGTAVWRIDLPKFGDEKVIKRRSQVAHYGPILAGGRLIVASSDGNLRSFDPASGQLIGATPIPGGAASTPAVAGGALYVVSKTGQLLGFR